MMHLDVGAGNPGSARCRRVRLSRAEGWRKPANTVVVARPTRWGNPFRADPPGSAAKCVALYERWLLSSATGKRLVIAAKIELRGKNLACWCPFDRPCHADVLIRIANEKG